MAMRSKLSRAKGMLCKIRYFVNHNTLRMVYYGIFNSILTYGSQIWGQHNTVVSKLQIIQNKALRIMNFAPRISSATPFFKSSGILKLTDNISLQNFLFAHDSLRNNLPSTLAGQLTLVKTHNNTRNNKYHQLNRISTNTIIYGTNSIKSKSVDVWNFINKDYFHLNLHQKSRYSCKKFMSNFLFDRY